MRRWIWGAVLVLYAIAGLVDGASRLSAPSAAAGHAGMISSVAVAFCAGLFWPIDIVARRLLGG